MSPLSVPNFSPIGKRIRVLWRILQSVRKEEVEGEKKKRRKKPKLWPIVSRKWIKKKKKKKKKKISEMDGAIFFKCGMWTLLPSWHFCSNFGFNRIRNHGATKV